MAKQKGHHRILGTTGDMTYQKTQDGYTVKEKLHISPEKFKHSEKYARVRENMAEFARAGKASRLFRTAVMALLKTHADTRMISRLTTQFLRVIKSDPVSDRGQRSLLLGELDTMTGFEFNVSNPLSEPFHTPYTVAVSRATGQCTVDIPAFQIRDAISIPEGATHCRLSAAAVLLDFDKQTYFSNVKTSTDLALSEESVAAITLTPVVPALPTLPLFMLLGVEFFMVTNGKPYTLNKAFNALRLVALDLDE